MTESELMRVLRRGRCVCDFWVVSYFLDQSWNQVDHLYESGRLPKATSSDGSDYRPSGERLVLADAFVDMVPEERIEEFTAWRTGFFDVVAADSREDVSRTIEAVPATGQAASSTDRSAAVATATSACTVR